MLRKRLVSDSTLVRLINAANNVDQCEKVGKRAYKDANLKAIKAALEQLDKKDSNEVLIFELADPKLKQARYDEWKRRSAARPDLANLPEEVQVQKMTGAYYFHLLNCIKRHVMREEGYRQVGL